MRTVKMQGGLGNQLFCLGLADRVRAVTGEPVALDLASFASDRYGHGFELAPLAERLGLTFTRRPIASSRLVTALMRRAPNAAYVSDGPPPTSSKLIEQRLRHGRYFNGYWQNEAWLRPGFRETVREHLLAKAPDTASHGLVIHYRTYQEEVRPERRAAPDAAWFERGLEHLRAAGFDLSDAALISDDPATALAWMGPAGAGVTPVTGGSMWSDMALMLRARALILTNSTFSWWGGFAGEAAMTLYPAKGRLFHYAPPARAFTVLD